MDTAAFYFKLVAICAYVWVDTLQTTRAVLRTACCNLCVCMGGHLSIISCVRGVICCNLCVCMGGHGLTESAIFLVVVAICAYVWVDTVVITTFARPKLVAICAYVWVDTSVVSRQTSWTLCCNLCVCMGGHLGPFTVCFVQILLQSVRMYGWTLLAWAQRYYAPVVAICAYVWVDTFFPSLRGDMGLLQSVRMYGWTLDGYVLTIGAGGVAICAYVWVDTHTYSPYTLFFTCCNLCVCMGGH